MESGAIVHLRIESLESRERQNRFSGHPSETLFRWDPGLPPSCPGASSLARRRHQISGAESLVFQALFGTSELVPCYEAVRARWCSETGLAEVTREGSSPAEWEPRMVGHPGSARRPPQRNVVSLGPRPPTLVPWRLLAATRFPGLKPEFSGDLFGTSELVPCYEAVRAR